MVAVEHEHFTGARALAVRCEDCGFVRIVAISELERCYEGFHPCPSCRAPLSMTYMFEEA